MNITLDIKVIIDYILSNGISIISKLLISVILWIIGHWLIKGMRRLFTRLLISNDKIDTTLAKYITSFISGLFTIGLTVSILSYLGVKTTSLAALLAGIGLAIGTAWSGLLTHFSAGIFLQVLRPFKIGDSVDIGGVEGDIVELGLFNTTILSVEHVITIIGNNKIFTEIIKNYSLQPYRRVNCLVYLDHQAPIEHIITQLKLHIPTIPQVLDTPPIQIGILDMNKEGIQLAVRPFCQTADYMAVRFAVYQKIAQIIH